tara:strand:- start:159 stop:1778 length:1620 start_codon:yes stop_codon:yes gene_type:complete
MAINFPANPLTNDTFTSGDTTWQYDGTAWNVVEQDFARNLFVSFDADTGVANPTQANDTLIVAGGNNITTTVTGKTITINGQSGGLTQNVFDSIVADEGSTTANNINDTLNILGGTNIATSIATDTDNVTINLEAFSINFLSDVDTTSSPPSTGQVLKWDGGKWAPGADATTGGAGTDADTLDGFDGSYYLDYNNLNNTPSILTLASLSIGVENTPSGNGAITYDNTSGVFKFTPPTAAGIGALTAEVNDLSAAVVWANVPNANITESSVTQHQAALSVTESQISDLQSYLTSVSASDLNSISIDALSDVDTTTAAPSNDQVLAWNGVNWIPADPATGGGGGDVNQNAFSNIAVTGQNTIAADTSTDTLNIVGGSGISVTTNDLTDTLTIQSTVTTGATAFTGLTDVTTAGLNVAEIYEPAMVMFQVDNDGIAAYTFEPHYTGNNPNIYVLGGTTVAFNLAEISGHPFEIQDPTASPYNTGLVHVSPTGTVTTGASAQGQQDGVLYWRIPESISGTYRYQCQSHSAMVGGIVVKRLSVI